MSDKFTIVVADKNLHVRELMKRELSAEGYNVCLVASCKEILKKNNEYHSYDLLVIDPDLMDMDESDLFKKLLEQNFNLPIIIHSYLSEDMNKIPAGLGAQYIEKNAGSIDHIKKVIKNNNKPIP